MQFQNATSFLQQKLDASVKTAGRSLHKGVLAKTHFHGFLVEMVFFFFGLCVCFPSARFGHDMEHVVYM